jgi:hypothetical protein
MNDAQWEKLITDSLAKAGEKIEPPRELLTSIIAKAKNSDNHISVGRFIFDFFNSRKIFFAAGVCMILLAVYFSTAANLKLTNQSENISSATIAESPTRLAANISDQDVNNNEPLTSDDVDVVTTAILTSISDEDLTLTDNVDDQSLTGEDGLAIDNLIQSYDQNQL